MDCVFCKIAQGEIESYRVYDDGRFFAFLDIRPLNPGHTLLIPRAHCRWIWDVDDAGAFFEAARKIALAQKAAFGTDYVAALAFGEEVPHAHLWLVPRFEGDGHGGAIDLANVKRLTPAEMAAARDKIIGRL